MISTPRKINAIPLNIKINQPKLATLCAYKLATHWQNFMIICLARVKILQKVLWGTFFCICALGVSKAFPLIEATSLSDILL